MAVGYFITTMLWGKQNIILTLISFNISLNNEMFQTHDSYKLYTLTTAKISIWVF